MKLKKVLTADQSPTLYVSELDEHYHSVNGAVRESVHVFINAGLKQIEKETVNILEIGFGTGLNTILSYTENIKLKKRIYYESLEKYPLSSEIINSLQENSVFSSEISKKIQQAIWEKPIKISDNFTLKKIQIDLLDYYPDETFDLIYFDAFSPDKQPELWTEDIFTKLYAATETNGILVTYSAKGIIKQALRKVGFTVKRLKGPEGKRHMVKAVK